MSPVGSALRVRMRMFPALVNCSTIDWFLPWPDEALLGVSTRQLEGMQGVAQEVKESVAQACCQVHQQVLLTAQTFEEKLRRKVYVTPKSYLDLISLYLEMITEKRDEKDVGLRRLQTGVDKIEEANGVVNGLQEELTKMAPFIVQKIKEADELVPIVGEEQKKAEVIKEKVAGEEAVVRKQADEVRVVQEDAQRDLDIAMPALETALKSLDALDKKDIQEIKSFPKPPSLVMMTMEAVNILLSEKPDWDTAKKVLSDTKFLDRLKGYDKDNIPAKALKQLEKYVVKPEYAPESVGNQSKAAKSLCMWTHAMDTYSKVAKEVGPKKQLVAELNEKLDSAMRMLKEKQDNLREVEEQVASLKKKLKDTVDEKDRLEAEAELTKNRLKRADILTVGLKDEGIRWRETVAVIRQDIINLTGDVFLSSASISYYGPFTGVYRNEIVDAWLKACKDVNIPCGDTFDLRVVMGNPVEIRDWNLQGLPTDAVSINNGVMVVRGKRWPLMIDPQAQGNKWIKKKEGKDLKAIKMSNPKMLLITEGCIRTGAPLLMEDVEETLDPALEPVLLKAIFENNGRCQIKLGDSEVDYDKNFLFYMTTKLPNPHYFPEVCIKVTVINFTVTFDGLEEQLLNEVVSKEIPETLQRRVELMLQLADDKKVLKQLEDKILKLLSESSGNILDDEVLINTLAESKETSTAVNQRVAEAEEAAIQIENACKEYTQVATCGAILYFVIADLANINPMYQFSLIYFVRLFNKCIDMAAKHEDIDIRMQYVQASILDNIFLNVCRGLFENDKLTFSFLITTAFQRQNAEITPGEWSLLLRGVGLLDMSQKPKNPDPDFFSEKMWEYTYAIQCLANDRCHDLCEHIAQYTEDWKDFVALDQPHLAKLPLDYEETNELHYFQIVLLLKGLCPEKCIHAVQEHVRRSMGDNFIIFPSATMQQLYDDSSRSTPIVFVLSTGADPTAMLLRFAQQMGMADTLGAISLGQGQNVKAIKLVDEGCKKGTWVLLQNCHLYKTFMPQLEKMCEGFEESNMIHKDFRLFLTSMPAAYFPVPVLQNGIKLTIEPPKGLRANVIRSFISMDDEELASSSKSKEWRRIQFGLKFFHAVVQERRKYGPLGWNIRYEFNDSDLETSTVITKNMLEIDGGIPWDTLLFVIGHINYGGRVTDDKDVKLISAFLRRYFNDGILEDGYKLSPLDNYYCPNEGSVEEVRDFVRTFPMDEDPQVFGLHSNAQITEQSQGAKKFLDTVSSVQPRSTSGGAGKSPEELVADMTLVFMARVPEQMRKKDAHPDTYKEMPDGGIVSLGVFHGQEMERFNSLISKVKSTLVTLGNAIKGLVVMSAQLEDMFNAFLLQQLPPIWGEPVSYPCLKPLNAWFADFEARVDFMSRWLTTGPPSSFWVSCFYFPQGFMTCSKQVHARKTKIPIDALSFFTDPTDCTDVAKAAPPEDGVNVHGLFVQGAGWDFRSRGICESEKGVLFVELPVMWMMVVMQDQYNEFSKEPGRYTCPLYKTSLRKGTLSTTGHSTNFVTYYQLPSQEVNQDHWIRRGVALLCMLDD
mmetsp:Transcript_47704/g.108527  ORF Transcript_47704/g.108527 Transcript_47704/m.108527 type:complete len:1551 (-) Transcript_47704:45-4697(-)